MPEDVEPRSDGVSADPRPGGPIISATSGGGDGTPLLLLHGLAASARWWDHVRPGLAVDRQVVAVDLPSFGESGRGVRFHLDRVPDQLIALLDAEGIERASIVGHSMGGLIAGRIAADHPERVDRLVLVDAGFLTLDPSLLHKVTGPIRAVRFTRPPLAKLLMEDLMRVGGVRLIEATLQLLQTDWVDALSLIRAPTLVVWGEGDTICPRIIGEGIVERVAGARMVVIPDSGHNPMWERPAEFLEAVLPFLEG